MLPACRCNPIFRTQTPFPLVIIAKNKKKTIGFGGKFCKLKCEFSLPHFILAGEKEDGAEPKSSGLAADMILLIVVIFLYCGSFTFSSLFFCATLCRQPLGLHWDVKLTNASLQRFPLVSLHCMRKVPDVLRSLYVRFPSKLNSHTHTHIQKNTVHTDLFNS